MKLKELLKFVNDKSDITIATNNRRLIRSIEKCEYDGKYDNCDIVEVSGSCYQDLHIVIETEEEDET